MSEDTENILRMGIEQGKKGNFTGAIDCFVKILKNDKNHSRAWHNSGVTWEEMGRAATTKDVGIECFKQAVSCYDEIIRIDKTDTEGWFGKGAVLSDYLGKPEEALDCFKKVIELSGPPKYHVLALMNIGIIVDNNDQPEEAIKCFKMALKIDKTNQRVWYSLGITLARSSANNETLKEALDCFTKSIELNNTHVNSWRSKAEILKILGDKEGSEFCMKKFQILTSNH